MVLHCVLKIHTLGLDPKKGTKSMSLLANTDMPLVPLMDTIENVRLKLEAKAYLHWYERYIPDIQADLEECLDLMSSVQSGYTSLKSEQ